MILAFAFVFEHVRNPQGRARLVRGIILGAWMLLGGYAGYAAGFGVHITDNRLWQLLLLMAFVCLWIAGIVAVVLSDAIGLGPSRVRGHAKSSPAGR